MDADLNHLSISAQRLHTGAQFSFFRAFIRHARESTRQHGLGRTLWQLISALYTVVQEQLPENKRAKHDDPYFDWENLVDTTRATVSIRTQLMCALAGHEYWPTEPWLFDQIMQDLPIDFGGLTFIDLGSGKGRILLMASNYPFRRIMGVELMPDLHRVAQENIAKYASQHQQCKQIESLCVDARDFQFPFESMFIYLFNPFPEPVFAAVLKNLKRSIEGTSRLVYVALRYLEFEHLLAHCPWLEKIAGTGQWAIYRNQVAGDSGFRKSALSNPEHGKPFLITERHQPGHLSFVDRWC